MSQISLDFSLVSLTQNDKSFVILSASEVSINLKCGLHLKVWIFRYAQNDKHFKPLKTLNLVILSLWRSIHKFKAYLKIFGLNVAFTHF